jgi:MSHA pilin protein MshA
MFLEKKLKKINSHGFTLIEIVIVIAIIGLLATMALPKFQDLSGAAKQATTRAGLGALRSTLAIRYAMSATGGVTASYPTTLGATDFQGGQAPTNALNTFTAITALSTTTTGTATNAASGFWYVTNSTAPDYGRAGAYVTGSVDSTAW